MILSNRQFSKSKVLGQEKSLNIRHHGVVHIRQALKALVIEWYCRGILPEQVVDRVFKSVDLRGA